MTVDIELLIRNYYDYLRSLDPAFHWSDPDWWKDPSQARVVVDRHGRGFAIVGYGRQVDADVASEICELYATSPWVVLPLVRACLPHLRPPAGCQVLVANHRARRCVEGLLHRLGTGWRSSHDLGPPAVIRYRFSGAAGAMATGQQAQSG